MEKHLSLIAESHENVAVKQTQKGLEAYLSLGENEYG